jgi:hypothetical protein
MADIKLSSKTTTAVTTGGYLYIIIPDGGSPTGFVGRRISVTDLQVDLRTDINTNTSDISSIDGRVTTLENNSSKILDSSKNSDYTFTQDANSEIEQIYIKNVSSNPTIKIGTTLAGEELVSETSITDYYKKDINFSDGYTATSRTIYITLSGGTVSIAYYSKKSIF